MKIFFCVVLENCTCNFFWTAQAAARSQYNTADKSVDELMRQKYTTLQHTLRASLITLRIGVRDNWFPIA